MANSNGPTQNNGRIEWSWTAPTASQSTTSINIPVYAYYRQISPYYQNYNGTKSWSGAWGSGSASQAYNLAANGRVLLVEGASGVVTLTDSPQSRSFTVTANHFFGSTSHTLWVQFPARYARTPTSVTVTRNSDSSHTLNWTRNSTYTSVVVQRSTNGSSGWVEVGRPSGNAATFTDTTTQANGRYYYRVAGIGGSGQSAWSSVAGPVYTTPSAVGSVTAEKVGSDIQVDVSGLPAFSDSFTVQASQSGGAFANLVTGVTSWPWTHVAPNSAVTWTYRVVSVKGSLQSAPSVASNTVQLLAPPLAPTGLAPNGGVAASDGDVRFLWVHNPVDTSVQSAYELRYRLVGGAWTTVSGTNAAFRDVTLALGNYEWQVRTKGSHAEFGAWSAVATVGVITRPGVAVQGDGTHDSPVFVAEWTYTQAESRPQSAWQVELLDADMQRLEFREGSGAQTSVTLSTRMVDGGEYTVQVRAATGNVWSDWSPLLVVASFEPPADPLVDAVWSELSGTVEISVGEGGGTVVADMLTIERSVDEVVWEPFIVGADFTDSLAFSDGQSLSNGSTWYRVSATYSVTGAAAVVVVEVVADSPHIWLSGGVSFGVTARLPFNPQIELEPGRERGVEYTSGSPLPVAYAGAQVSRVAKVGGMVAQHDVEESAYVDELTILAQHPSPVHLLRTPDGLRMFGAISSIPMPRQNGLGWWGYSFTLTETSF